MLGAFLIQGLDLGPNLFKESPEVVFSLMVALLFTNFIMLYSGYYGSRYFINVLRIPQEILTPIIIVFSVVGTYAIRSSVSVFDVYILFFFGVLGYFMEKYDFSLAALILGLILGPLAEANLQRVLALSDGHIGGLFNSFISFIFIGLTCLSIISSIKIKLPKRSFSK